MKKKAKQKIAQLTILLTLITFHFHAQSQPCPSGNVLFVDANVAPGGGNNGTSWNDAYNDLQDALALADNCGNIDQIWVAAGTYYPTDGTDRTISFVLKNNLAIYGGFAGGETSLGARNWTANVTILSGDLMQNDGANFTNNGDNSYHVVRSSNKNNTAVLDGFTITGGNADGSGNNGNGAGMLNSNSSPKLTNCSFSENSASVGGGMFNHSSDPIISNCIFSGNSASNGGGMYNESSFSSSTITNSHFLGNSAAYGGGMYNFDNSNPELTNCYFTDNNVLFNGGGMYNNASSNPKLTNCSLVENSAPTGGGMSNDNSSNPELNNCYFLENLADNGGGGMHNDTNSNPELNNCYFSGNSAKDGGAIFNENSSPTLTNCTISGNSASNNIGGLYNTGFSGSDPTITNCILWGNLNKDIGALDNKSNPNISYTLLGRPTCPTSANCGAGMLYDIDPLFISATDLRLQPCSSAIDAGATQAQAPMGVTIPTTDFDGEPRPQGAGIDMGFDENGANCCPAGNILYVNENANGNNNGTSWGDAFNDLQDALALFNGGTCPNIDQIWVAAGTYYPDEGMGMNPNGRGQSFFLKNNLAIYGGFTGGETSLGARNWTANVTILSGDLMQNDGANFANNDDNSYHVVRSSNKNNTAILDGFTISGGNADGSSYPNEDGGGMYNNNSSPTVANCSFSGNSANIGGGGMHNTGSSPEVTNCSFSRNEVTGGGGGMFNVSSSSPAVTNCSFSGNSASSDGGGMYNNNSSPTVTNCSFSENSASSDGGGMFNQSSSPEVTNCSFSGNSASSNGGGMNNQISSSPTVTNCSFSGNSADIQGGGISNSGGSKPKLTNCSLSGNTAPNGGGMHSGNLAGAVAEVTNCIFWGNSSSLTGNLTIINDCIIQGGCPPSINNCNNVIDQDPLFVSATDLHLQPCSPAIDAGTASVPMGVDISTDFDGEPRPQGAGIDIGFDENGANCCPAGNILYVNENATGNNNGTSWDDAFNNLQDALTLFNGGTCPNIDQIWVAAGTYYPTDGTDRTISFVMKNNLAIYGGFAGGETSLGARNWTANVTTLSGDLMQNDGANFANNDDNSYHVVRSSNKNNTAVLDGFTITGGNANGVGNNGIGAGMLNSNSSPTVTNCSFSANTATTGGGMYNFDSSPEVTNCSFSGNSANAGGGMYNIFSSPEVTNCSFSANSANLNGGGMYNFVSSPEVTNCSFSENSASINGGGMYNNGSSPEVTNCILWGNGTEIVNISSSIPTVTYSIVQGGYAGTGNLDVDPLFVSATDLSLQAASPAIDAGDDDAPGLVGITTDLAGNNRKFDAIPGGALIDMGAYEFQGLACQLSAVCQDVTAQLDGAGQVSVDAVDLNGGSTGCGTLIFAIGGMTSTSFDCDDLGTNTVSLTVTDDNGSATCTSNVTVVDDVAPNALCQDINKPLGSGTGGSVTLLPSDVNNGSADNCGGTAGVTLVSVMPNSFDCSSDAVQTVTLTVKDAQDITATCNSQVTLMDGTAPTAACKNATVQLDASGNGSIVPADVDNNSTDNCGITSMSLDVSAFTCMDIPSKTVELTVSDAAGNSHSCTATVTVQDLVAPNAVCQNISIGLDPQGNAGITGSQVDNGSNDACGIATFAASPNTFTAADIGNNPVTLTVTDNNGQSAACQATVTVTNDNPPVANCQNAAVTLDGMGNATVTTAMVNNGSSAIGGIQSMGVNPSTLTCNDIPSKMVTLTVTDVNGNPASTCMATVTVEDNVLPNMLCRDVVVQLDASGNGSVTPGQVDNGSTDACGIASLVVSPNSFTLADEGINTVALTATDVNGNPNTCTANVTVENNQLPNAVCQNISRNLDVNGQVNLTGMDIDGGSSALGGIMSLTADPDMLDCSNIGPNTVTLTVLGNNGQSATCNATVTVSDMAAPTANCQDKTVQLDAAGNASVTTADINNNSSDNCGTASLALDVSTFTCDDMPQKTVGLTVTDNSGNPATCTATVTVQDNVLPSMACQDMTVALDMAGNASIVPGDVDNGSSDACGINTLTVSPNTFTLANVGINQVTLTATDVNGNPNSCTANVTVENNQLPNAVCQNINRNLDVNGEVNLTGADIDGGSSVLGGIASLTVDPSLLTCGNLGPNTVTLTVLGNNGQSATCDATVTVSDILPATALCQNTTVFLDVAGNASIVPADVDNNSSDNCGIASMALDVSTFTCNDMPQKTVMLTVNDVNGNAPATCTAVVTVVDNVAPTATCQPHTVQLGQDGLGSMTAADIDGGSGDACGIGNLAASQTDFDCSHLGANTVTLTVTDANGQTTTCNSTVTVEDNVLPTASCENITVVLDVAGNASIAPADVDNGSSDNCSFSLGLDISSFTCDDIPSKNVTLTVTDGSGNPATCISILTIEDNTAPGANCQPVTIELDVDGNASVTAAQVDNGSSDACGVASMVLDLTDFGCDDIGDNTVTLTVTDVNLNPATCTATVTVEDNVEPSVVCQDIGIELDGSGNATIEPEDVFDAVNSNDNCGSLTPVSVSPSQFDCGEIGDNTVTLSANDGNGNQSTCTAVVTVADFFTGLSVATVPETCGMGNGSISITVESPGGQIGYSIDGGATWQFTGVFTQLSSGIYEVMVQAYGTYGCSTPSETVEVGQVGEPTMWYMDYDGDGYAGNISIESCVQPPYYYPEEELIATSGDCNDYDANEYPGQTWWLDWDGDGYTDGTSIVQCSQPANYVADAQPGDCDDTDSAVHPGAVEICNGIDDDCDGETDEDVTGGQTWTGNVLLASQADVDAWLACYSVIDGNLTIKNSGVNDLSNLINLVEVTGFVYIKATSLTSMAGLDNLATIGDYFKVQSNNSLTTLNGLEGVTTVGGDLFVFFNNILTDCCAIYELLESGGVGGSITIFRNDTGCDSVSDVEDDCSGNDPLIAPPTCNDCGVLEGSAYALQFELFPNPATTVINVRLLQSPKVPGTVTLFNVMGQAITTMDLAIGQKEASFDVRFKKASEYIVRVTTERGAAMKRVMVVR